MFVLFRKSLLFCALLHGALPAIAGYKDDVGYTKLQAELSGNLPTGSGISVSQIEASLNSSSIICYPDTSLGEFSGKSFQNKTGSTSVSDHATSVARNFYSSTNSLAPGITTIDVYNASSWIGGSFLRTGNATSPSIEIRDIENHSWIGSSGDNAVDQEILRRLDFAIQRDDFVATIGLNNGFGNPVPSLLGSSYNGISVGLTNGNHSSGLTAAYEPGRRKPDIVAPDNFTSFATPEVGAAAALLYGKLRSNYSLANFSVVVKALLLAGATKTQFPSWSRTSSQPLDARYGAGQLNIYRSYHDLDAGRQNSSASVSAKQRGWDFNATNFSTSRLYFFDVVAGNTASGFSGILTWNRIIETNPNWPITTSSVADLSLKLYQANGFTVGAVYDTSESPVDNVEHIYQPNLPPGRYALEVTSASTTSTNYGLAWTSVPTIAITASTADASEMGGTPGGFTLTRAGDTTSATQVFFTIGGSATNGTDYSSIVSSITFAAGETSKIITVSPQADNVAEGDETVTLSLVNDLAYGFDANGSATVTIHDLPFDAWRFGKFSTTELTDLTVSGPAADPDFDGVANLLEYAFSTEPKSDSSAALPVIGLANGMPSLTFTRVKAATDLIYTPEISDDLMTWNSGPDFLTESSVIDQGATESVTVTGNSNAPAAQFLRVRVTRP